MPESISSRCAFARIFPKCSQDCFKKCMGIVVSQWNFDILKGVRPPSERVTGLDNLAGGNLCLQSFQKLLGKVSASRNSSRRQDNPRGRPKRAPEKPVGNVLVQHGRVNSTSTACGIWESLRKSLAGGPATSGPSRILGVPPARRKKEKRVCHIFWNRRGIRVDLASGQGLNSRKSLAAGPATSGPARILGVPPARRKKEKPVCHIFGNRRESRVFSASGQG